MSNSLTCPYCSLWTADCECLPKEQGEWRPIQCAQCEKVYAIKWEIRHTAEKLENMGSVDGAFAAECVEIIR